MPSPAELRDHALLVTLARKKGFSVEVSVVPDLWRLIGAQSLRPARALTGALAFTPDEAHAFLDTLPDA